MSLKDLARELRSLYAEVRNYVDERLEQFRTLGREGKTRFNFLPFLEASYTCDVFSELSFCLLTANFPVERGILIQKSIGSDGFSGLGKKALESRLRRLGHRFPAQRAERITRARRIIDVLLEAISKEKSGKVLRERLTSGKSEIRVTGLGYKEASHFLRNVGFDDVAIIDRHVFRFLVNEGICENYKTLTPSRYLEAERRIEELSRMVGIPLSALDLVIFYRMTGKILK